MSNREVIMAKKRRNNTSNTDEQVKQDGYTSEEIAQKDNTSVGELINP